MPIYEYECKGCGKQTEAIQKFDDPPLTHCDTCGGELSKLISRTSFQLKGTGWYASDYKKTPAPVAKKEEPAAAAPAQTKKPCGSGSCGSD